MYDGQRKERLTFFKAEIRPKHADVLLFACCLCSGLVDSTLYNGEWPLTMPYTSDRTDRNSVQHVRVHADRSVATRYLNFYPDNDKL